MESSSSNIFDALLIPNCFMSWNWLIEAGRIWWFLILGDFSNDKMQFYNKNFLFISGLYKGGRLVNWKMLYNLNKMFILIHSLIIFTQTPEAGKVDSIPVLLMRKWIEWRVEQKRKKKREEELMDMDNDVVIVEGRGVGRGGRGYKGAKWWWNKYNKNKS